MRRHCVALWAIPCACLGVAITAMADVGRTPGEFNVSASGASQYTVLKDVNPEIASKLEPMVNRAIYRSELVGPRITQEAAKKGFDRIVKDSGIRTKEKVFSNGKTLLTRDTDSHSGGVWKMFDKTGKIRLGTFDENLVEIGP